MCFIYQVKSHEISGQCPDARDTEVDSFGSAVIREMMSSQRCHSKCVSEQTFYRLVQAFAVVLFE